MKKYYKIITVQNQDTLIYNTMGFYRGPKIVTNGLDLYIDAANPKSYPSGGLNWWDLSRNKNNGMLSTKFPIFDSANKGSVFFDGVDDFATFSHEGDSNAFTYQIFLKSSNITKDQIYVGYGGDSAHYIRIVNSRAFLSVRTTTTQRTLQHSTILQNDEVYFITSIYNGTQLKIYVNDVLVSGSVLNEPLSKWGTTYLARWRPTDPRYFEGNIFLLKAYSRELSHDEILQNYKAIKTRF